MLCRTPKSSTIQLCIELILDLQSAHHIALSWGSMCPESVTLNALRNVLLGEIMCGESVCVCVCVVCIFILCLSRTVGSNQLNGFNIFFSNSHIRIGGFFSLCDYGLCIALWVCFGFWFLNESTLLKDSKYINTKYLNCTLHLLVGLQVPITIRILFCLCFNIQYFGCDLQFFSSFRFVQLHKKV